MVSPPVFFFPMLYLSFVLATTITDHDDNWCRPNKNNASTPTTHSTCQTGDSNNSSSSSGSRRDSSRAAGMFYFFIIRLIFLGLLYALKRWWHSSSISNGSGSIGSSSGNDKGNSNSRGRRGLSPWFFQFLYIQDSCVLHHTPPFSYPHACTSRQCRQLGIHAQICTYSHLQLLQLLGKICFLYNLCLCYLLIYLVTWNA